MEVLQTIALIGIILATYTYIVKTVLKNFSKATGVFSSLFWGLLSLATLSFIFSSNSSNYHNNSNYNCYGNDNDDIYDIEDDCYNNDLFEDQDDCDYSYDD